MATFVHLAPESRLALIQRNGINRLRKAFGRSYSGIFAVPVTRNFYVSHQWLRELKRGGPRTYVGIYFRIPNVEKVWVGHYGGAHQAMTAAEAVAEFLSADSREGWEVIIPRRIEPKEIRRVRSLPQVVGWRYYPQSKGKRPCTCELCTRGAYGGRKLRERFNVE